MSVARFPGATFARLCFARRLGCRLPAAIGTDPAKVDVAIADVEADETMCQTLRFVKECGKEYPPVFLPVRDGPV
jgi:hypothetical protein